MQRYNSIKPREEIPDLCQEEIYNVFSSMSFDQYYILINKKNYRKSKTGYICGMSKDPTFLILKMRGYRSEGILNNYQLIGLDRRKIEGDI